MKAWCTAAVSDRYLWGFIIGLSMLDPVLRAVAALTGSSSLRV